LIQTERLELRRVEGDDVDELVAMYADPDVREFIPSAANYDRAVALGRVASDAEDWDAGRRTLIVCERATDRFLGRVAIIDWPEFGETEVGWIFASSGRGRGYATEAGRAAQEWAFEHLDVPYLTALIRADNAPSIGVAERLGMAPIRDDELLGVPVVVYAITREAAAAR
jgi:RimJ/RimL family protein N-acetyltransferase